MPAAETTKFQINFKLNDGTLINIYADSQAELESELTSLQDLSALIGTTSGALSGTGGAASLVAAQLGARPVQHQQDEPAWATRPAAPAPVAAPTGEPNSCKHGAMVYRESKPGSARAWKGYFCPSPKGTPDQCEPKFLKG